MSRLTMLITRLLCEKNIYMIKKISIKLEPYPIVPLDKKKLYSFSNLYSILMMNITLRPTQKTDSINSNITSQV